MIRRSLAIIFFLYAFNAGAQVNKPLRVINNDSVRYWVQKVEKEPDSLAYHHEYIRSIGWEPNLYWYAEKYKARYDSTESVMRKQYEQWLRTFSQNATVHYAIGTAYYENESPKATEFLKRTVALDKTNAEAYLKLAIDAERWGNQEQAMEYMRLASLADSSNPSYAFYYAMYFDDKDMVRFTNLIYALADRFPAHERGAQGFYWLGYNVKDQQKKIQVLEELRKRYDPTKFNWSASGMSLLYNAYLNNVLNEKARDLAADMSPRSGWQEKVDLANGLTAITSLMQSGKYELAYDSIVRLKKLRSSAQLSRIPILEASLADKSGQTLSGYQSLVALQAKAPTDEIGEAVNVYGRKIGKTVAQISADIQEIRKKNSKPAYPFDLGMYTSSTNAKLSDFKGKAVLITFWFPGCGPCRAEFPHFENVVRKFKDADFEYLGINVFPTQDDYVLPFLKGTRYSFTPLRATSDWAKDNYGVRGQPTNFLLDKEGNIVYANFRTDQDNERTLELMIRSLL
jgi:thiol-disulfide isomerase/thioredoxin